MCKLCKNEKANLLFHGIDATTNSDRDRKLLQVLAEVQWERYILPFGIILVALGVFGPVIIRGIIT